jgi:hypothetical protein
VTSARARFAGVEQRNEPDVKGDGTSMARERGSRLANKVKTLETDASGGTVAQDL